MRANFEPLLQQVLLNEGTWSDDPDDPGGATMKGVTLNVFRDYYGDNMGKENLKNITEQQLQHIYKTGYWDKCRCDDLPNGIDYPVFDAAVNSGPGQSARFLQTAVSASVDGIIGPNTLSLTDRCQPADTINELLNLRLAFLQDLKTWAKFGAGWSSRINDVRSYALAMIGDAGSDLDHLANDSEAKTLKKGSRGNAVRRLQSALNIDADGIYGSDTEAAVKGFQRRLELAVDGIAGKNTLRVLGLSI